MKKRILAFLILIVAIIKFSEAQINYNDGYIITLQNDTIYGKIINNKDYTNSLICDFKPSNTDSFKRYFPNNIVGYRFTDGKYFISKVIDNKNIFLEYLIKGRLSIYFNRDENGDNHYYFSKDTSALMEFKYNRGLKSKDGVESYYESRPYIGLLNYYTFDCPSLEGEISQLESLNHKTLIKFAKKYHDLTCKNEKCIIYEKKMPSKIKFSMYGGPTYFFVDMNSFSTDGPGNFKQDYTRKPLFGFNILFQQSRISEKMYLGIGYMDLFRIPVSINYLNPRQGFSPLISYELDLNTFLFTQAIDFGVKYQMKKIAFFLIANLKTAEFVIPYSGSLNVGLTFDLK